MNRSAYDANAHCRLSKYSLRILIPAVSWDQPVWEGDVHAEPANAQLRVLQLPDHVGCAAGVALCSAQSPKAMLEAGQAHNVQRCTLCQVLCIHWLSLRHSGA